MNAHKLVLARHAWERYCQRVEPIEYEQLQQKLQKQITRGYHRKQDYIQIGNVWWRCTISRHVMVLHTCYGQSHIDIPAAIKWAKLHGDRLALGD